MANQDEVRPNLLSLAPELQLKVFEALPSPRAAMDLAMSCRALHTLHGAFRKQIMAAIRDNMVAPFHEYYAFLTSMCVPESQFHQPPPGGWAITSGGPLGRCVAPPCKSDFAADVVRHLPVVMGWLEDPTIPLDDRGHGDGDTCGSEEDPCRPVPSSWPEVLQSTPAGRHRVLVARRHHWHARDCCDHYDLLLDTSTGVLSDGWSADGRRVEVEACPVREYFARRVRWCRELRMVLLPGHDSYFAGGDGGGEEETYDAAALEEKAMAPAGPTERFDLARKVDRQWVRHLYSKFGWPGADWRKKEGLEAITEYIRRRNAEADERRAELKRKREERLRRLGPVVGALHCF